jgi:hypothetical protein
LYQVYQIERNVSGSLNLLCLGAKIKVKFYIMSIFFHTEEYDQIEKPIIVEFMLRDQFLMILKLIIMGS